MPTPDISEALGLTLFDLTAADLTDRALTNALTALPGETFPDGSLEAVLIESLALITAELVYAANRIPGAVMESLLTTGYGIPRSQGTPATTTLQLSAGPNGASIPAGTLARLGTDDDALTFATTTALIIAAGTATGIVAATATTTGASANGTATGTPVAVLSVTTGVTAAVLAAPVAGGTDPEDADAFLARAANRLGRLTSVLAQPPQFNAFALEQVGVARSLTIDNYNVGAAGTVTMTSTPGVARGTEPGFTTVAVLGPAGTLLSAQAKTDIAAAMTAQAVANLAVRVIDPTITPVNVTLTVVRLPGYTDADITARVTAALTAYLSPAAWSFAGTVRRNDLVGLVDNVPGVDYLPNGQPSIPAADVVLPGVAPLPTLGVLQLTVLS